MAVTREVWRVDRAGSLERLTRRSVAGPFLRPAFERLRADGRYVLYGAADFMPPGARPGYLRLAVKCEQSIPVRWRLPRRTNMRLRLTVCLAAIVSSTACAPMFSDARMLRRGQVEVTPAVSPVYVSENEDTTHVWNDYGVRAQFGVNSRVNVGAGYNRTQFAHGEDYGFHTIAFGPKFGLVADRVAVAMPVGFSFGEDIEVGDTWQVHPTLLMTFPMNQHVDFNPAVRLVIPTREGGDKLVAVHAGFGVRTGHRLVLRPEVAIVFNPGEDGVVWTFGLGASLRR